MGFPNLLKILWYSVVGLVALSESGLFFIQHPHLKAPGLLHLKKAPHHPSSVKDNNRFLQGNFAPIQEEMFVTDLPIIQGYLPPDLDGVYARVGPNPVYISSGYHWFDGDGYIHAIRLSPSASKNTSKVNYSGTFVQTSKLKQELRAGRALFSKFGDLHGPVTYGHLLLEGLRSKLGVINQCQGVGTANTALAFHAGSLLALHEGDQPYQMGIFPDGRLANLGRVHKGGKSPSSWFTAHPKIDPSTKKMYAFGYQLDKKPYITFYKIDARGRQEDRIPLDFRTPTMVHDFAITEHYAIFPEASMLFSPFNPLRPGRSIFKFDHKKQTRFFILHLNATSISEGQWITLPPSFLFHIVNAWEEGDTIRMFALRCDGFELDSHKMQEVKQNPTEQDLEDSGIHLWEYQFYLSTGEATEKRLMPDDHRTFEFPHINPRYVGRPNRYMYSAVYHSDGLPRSFAKVDLQEVGKNEKQAVKVIDLEEGVTGGEALFVPRMKKGGQIEGRFENQADEVEEAEERGKKGINRGEETDGEGGEVKEEKEKREEEDRRGKGGMKRGEGNEGEEVKRGEGAADAKEDDQQGKACSQWPSWMGGKKDKKAENDEDDGYLLLFTYDEVTHSSEFRIYDAKSMSSTPLTRIALPQRVPYGFHTTFVPASDLPTQPGYPDFQGMPTTTSSF